MQPEKNRKNERGLEQKLEQSIANAKERRKKALEEIDLDSLSEEELSNLDSGGIGHTAGMMIQY